MDKNQLAARGASLVAQENATDKLVVSAIEAKTPISDKLAVNAAAVRAGISGYEEFPEYYPLLTDEEADSYPSLASFDSKIFGA